MTRVARVKGKEVVRALQKAGFHVSRSRGSHVFLKHPDGRATAVPIHSGETIGIGLMAAILRDVGMDAEQFSKFL